MKLRRRQNGQALVEFAFALPLLALFILVVIQLSLVLLMYYSQTRMARETARWLAINSSSIDSAVATHVQNTMLPGMIGGSPSVDAGSNTTDAWYHVGNMTVKYTACGASVAPCPNTNRASGNVLYVQMSYDISNLVFLPTTYGMGWVSTKIPTGLPVYRVSVMVE